MKFGAVIIVLCLILATVVAADPAIRIGRPMTTSPGNPIDVDIYYDNTIGREIGGFDLFMTYDSSLSLQNVSFGDLTADCVWEYLTYRTEGLNGIRLVAMADINNGPFHPSCYADTSGVLARITFLPDFDPLIEVDFLTIRFMWLDCGDNTISSVAGDTMFISNDVYYFNGVFDQLITNDTIFPTPCGAPDECLPNFRGFDFYSGGVYAVINDTDPPMAICPGDIYDEADQGQCGTVVTFEATVTDNAPDATISCYPPSGSFFESGATAVTCIAIDISGNADTCGFTVNVADTQPPVAECPDNITVPCIMDNCYASAPYTANVSDNCPGATISCFPPPTAFFSTGTTPVTCIALDAAGNADTCSFDVSVVDQQPPQLICPEDITVTNDSGQCGAVVAYEVSATDNCPVVSITCDIPSESFLNVGTTTITCIAVDAFENADTGSFDITVLDTEAPKAFCPGDITVANDSGECGARISFETSVSDNCEGASIICDPPSGALFPTRPLDVTCIAVDASGNADTCSFVMTVIDTQPPIILPPDDIIAANDPGQCGAVVEFEATVIDNCANATYSCDYQSGSFFPVGINEVTCIGRDGWDNADTTVFPVIVSDTTRPVLGCPANIEVLNDSGSYGAIVFYTPTATDNCPDVNIVSYPPSGSYFEQGTTAVDVIASDHVGNAVDGSFNVIVILNDPDGDGFPDWDDNCPEDHNPEQADKDGDGIGDICDWSYGDANGDDIINVGDVVFLIAHVFKDGPAPEPVMAGDANCDGQTNVADAVFLINHIFRNGPFPDCS